MSKRVAVIGAGALGVTAAHDLETGGADVTIFEREEVAAGSSGRAAGVLYDAYAEDVDAALADRAFERFRAFDGRGDFELSTRPYVLAVRDGDADAEAIPAMVDRMRQNGRDVSVVEPDALADRFSLETDDLAIAAVAENAAVTDPAAYTHAMADEAVEAGVTLRTHTPVELDDADPTTVSVDGKRRSFDAVLVAAGAHTASLLADAGHPIAMKPYRVQALTATRPYHGPIVYDSTAGVYARPHPTGLLAGDGTELLEVDADEWSREADDWFIEDVAACLRTRLSYQLGIDRFPTDSKTHNDGQSDSDSTETESYSKSVIERAWAGLCTATPDGDPLLGERHPGLYVATGWQGHGFMLAPATAEVIADQMLGGDGIDHFSPTRFSGTEEFDITEGMRVENR